jgi:hypothetical protein
MLGDLDQPAVIFAALVALAAGSLLNRVAGLALDVDQAA